MIAFHTDASNKKRKKSVTDMSWLFVLHHHWLDKWYLPLPFHSLLPMFKRYLKDFSFFSFGTTIHALAWSGSLEIINSFDHRLGKTYSMVFAQVKFFSYWSTLTVCQICYWAYYHYNHASRSSYLSLFFLVTTQSKNFRDKNRSNRHDLCIILVWDKMKYSFPCLWVKCLAVAATTPTLLVLLVL